MKYMGWVDPTQPNPCISYIGRYGFLGGVFGWSAEGLIPARNPTGGATELQFPANPPIDHVYV